MARPESVRRLRLLWPGSVRTAPLAALLFLIDGCTSLENQPSTSSGSAARVPLASTNAVPIEVEEGQVYVRATVNGQEVRLLLDTGASHVFVSTETAEAAKVGNTKPLSFAAFGDERTDARQGMVRWLVVGPTAAENVPVLVLPVPAVFSADGFLGLSFLRRFVFRLDYDRKLLSFADPGGELAPCTGSSLPLHSSGPLVTVLLELNGIPAKLLLDTGAGQELILRPWFVEQYQLRERYPRRLSVTTGRGVAGETRGEISRFPRLELGNYTLTNVFAEFQIETSAPRDDIAGFLGAAILRKFNLTFDLSRGQVCFEPNSEYGVESPPPPCVRSGMVFAPEGNRWIVRDVVPGSPAAEAGVCVDDEIVEINGVLAESGGHRRAKQALQAQPGTRVRLRLRTGLGIPRDVELTLRDLI
jgi:predicted aspartyl protease